MQVYKYANMKVCTYMQTKGKSQAYNWQNSYIPQAYLKQISGKYQTYLGKSETYQRHILGQVWANLRIYQEFLQICLRSSYFSIASVVQSLYLFFCLHFFSPPALTMSANGKEPHFIS